MDTRNGSIVTSEALKKIVKELPDEAQHFIEMDVSPTEEQMARRPPKVGRNEPCPCGSGRKFKKCHLNRSSRAVLQRDR